MATPQPLVLVVEDDPDLAALTCEVLEVEGFTTVAARHGAHALSLLEQGLAPQVVVCDMMMPVLDGFGFLAGLARRAPPHAPVLAVSAFEPYLERAGAAGAAATLSKPFEMDQLVAAVRTLASGRSEPSAPARTAEALTERKRLAAVLRLRLEEPAPGPALQAFTERVAAIFSVPVALVSVVTADRQHWRASCGLPGELHEAGGTPREHSFCTHSVAARAALIVQDARGNPFFADNELVRSRGVRFYAGVPLVARFGEPVGTLCLLDFVPRAFGAFDLDLLRVLARRVVAEFERRELGEHPAPRAAFAHLDDWDDEHDLLGRETFLEALRLEGLRAAERRTTAAAAVVVVPAAELPGAVAALKGRLPRAHLGRLGAARLGVAENDVSGDVLAAEVQVAAGPGALVRTAELSAPGDAAARLAVIEAALGDSGLVARRPEPPPA
jgi:CheY-like chemotaxis protein